MNIADLLKEILGRTGLQRTNDQGMEKKPTDGQDSGKTLKPETFMNQQTITKDPANVYDEHGNIVDYKPGGRSITEMLSGMGMGAKAGAAASGNPFAGLLANGGSGQGTLTGFLSRMLSPTPERNAPNQVQGQGTVGGGDPNAGTPGMGIDPGLNPVPSKDQKVPAFADRTPTGSPTPLPLADQPQAPPPADYSMPNALDPQQIEELRSSLLTQSGQLNPDNPNSLAGRMGDPNSKVDMQDQMRQAEDISNAVQPMQKGDLQW